MTHEKGDWLYTLDGQQVVFDHAVGDIAYVHPVLKVVVQSTTYHGDDFDEDEDLQPADHLISVFLEELSETPPVEAFDAVIAARKADIEQLVADAKKEERQIKSRTSEAHRELSRAEAQLRRWRETHKVMEDLGKMLDGEEVYPLSAQKDDYNKGPRLPHVPKWRDVDYLTVNHNRARQGEWTCKKRHLGANFEIVFFDSDKERRAEVKNRWAILLNRFRKMPDYSDTTHSSRLNYATLVRWVEHWNHLTIPEDIEEGKREADEQVKEAKRQRLQKQLDGLE